MGIIGISVNSVASKPCVVSKLRNNFINSTIMVTFDNFVPRCKESENPQKTDRCVIIENLGLFESAKLFIRSQLAEMLLNLVLRQVVANICVNTKIPFFVALGANGCEDGFRIVYAKKIGSIIPSSYFLDDAEDCGAGNTHVSCQQIWGINTGEFIDIELPFPRIETASNDTTLITSFILKDINKADRSFNASIVREEGFEAASGLQRQSNQICVFGE